MLGDRDGDDHVAVLAAVAAGTPLAAQADLLPVVDARGDAHGHGPPVGSELDGGAGHGVAQGQGRAGDHVGALDGLGLGGEASEAEGAARAPAPEAARAAGGPELAQELIDVGLGASRRGEADVAAPAAEHRGEDVLEAGAGAARPGGEAGSAAGHGADGVVLLAFLGVGQDRVGLPDLLELLGRCGVVGVAVGVVLLGEGSIRLLDGCGVGVLGDAEDRVEVLGHPVLAGHGSPPPCPGGGRGSLSFVRCGCVVGSDGGGRARVPAPAVGSGAGPNRSRCGTEPIRRGWRPGRARRARPARRGGSRAGGRARWSARSPPPTRWP